eukprot:TRINITY_DN1720_c0_g2_i1.p1 TRINITY_DN1720_c0_g2~~TRINITY_DN1720_c0_g2_i1.p1  ORF type:complete len:163 (-),score=30.61 TRINITY_DN1720_c0_g2_i1:103-591(-)
MVSLSIWRLAVAFLAGKVASHEVLLDQSSSGEFFEEQYPSQQYPPQQKYPPQQYQQYPPQQYQPQQYGYASSQGYPATRGNQAPQELGITEQDKLLPLNVGLKLHSDDSILAGDKKPNWRQRKQFDSPAIMEWIGSIYTSAAIPGANCPWLPLLVLLALQWH